jgi:hypothetical protein
LDVISKQAFDPFRLRFEEALSGTDVHYEAEADYDLVGQRRISAAYKPTVDVSKQGPSHLEQIERLKKEAIGK